MRTSRKIHILALLVVIITTAVVFSFASNWINDRPVLDTDLGITFSVFYADQLGLSYQEVYQELIEEMGVTHVRLPIYWSQVETLEGNYDWSSYDWLLDYSQEHDLVVTPVVGMKVPRWPECFVPDWAEGFNENAQHEAVMSFIKMAVERYQSNNSIVRWQVENEPTFPFGICPDISTEQFQERVELVRSLDDRPIQVTVSGEIGPWLDQTQEADVLGFSLYRQTWNDAFGYFVYPLSPEYYYFRIKLVEGYADNIIVSELQAEPWFPEPIENQEISHWYSAFDDAMLEENVEFALRTGVDEAYLWGAEWWYYLKSHGETRLWDKALSIFTSL